MVKYADIEKSIRDNLDTWLCNLYFSIEPREPLAHPYTTELDLDSEAHNKIAQVLNLDEEPAERDRMFSHDSVAVNNYNKIYDETSQPSNQGSGQKNDLPEVLQASKENRIAELLKEENSEDEDISPSGAKKVYAPLEKPEDYDPYTFHLPRNELKTRTIVGTQVRYILEEVLADFGFRNVPGLEFWISAIFICLTGWLRAYIHYFGSWIYLRAASIPITTFDAGW